MVAKTTFSSCTNSENVNYHVKFTVQLLLVLMLSDVGIVRMRVCVCVYVLHGTVAEVRG